MTTFVSRSLKRTVEENPYILLDASIIQNPDLSYIGKGYYCMLEAEAINLKDVPKNIKFELKLAGYLKDGVR